MATMTGPSLPETAGPWMCAAVTLPLSHRANTTPNTVMRGDFSGLPSTRLRTKTPDGFVSAFATEPVAWLSSKMGRDPTEEQTMSWLACLVQRWSHWMGRQVDRAARPKGSQQCGCSEWGLGDTTSNGSAQGKDTTHHVLDFLNWSQ